MIYLFCNSNYGQPFLEVARKFSKEKGVNITIIFSSKTVLPKQPFHKIFFILKHSIKTKLKAIKLSVSLGLPTLLVNNINSPNFYHRIKSIDHGIVAGFNQIFKPEIIEQFNTLVNFHPSILPFYRGPVPSCWCLKNQEDKTGYTLHRITEKIDDGEILFQEEVTIGDIEKSEILDQRIAQYATKQLWQYLEHIRTGEPWISIQLDANKIYKKKVNYMSFPKKLS